MSSGSHLGSRAQPTALRGRPRAQARRIAAGLRAYGGDARVFGACVLVVLIHLVDVALSHPAGLLLAAIVLLPAAVMLFARRGRGVRALLAGLVGLAATLSALAVDIPHAVLAGAAGSDYTGTLSAIAGIVLIALAFRIGLRGRRPWVKLSVGIVSVCVIAQWLVAPAVNAGLATNAPRPAIAGAQSLGLPGARDVSFTARDGVRLAGWYVPGRSRTVLIVLHGSHDTRMETLAHVRMLSAAGYGVLAYDARGHGASAGQTNALGWSGADDLAGAVSFLHRQPGVDPRRIAALGLSMGAEESLRAAAVGVPLAAVIADGAGASTLADAELASTGISPVFVSVTWLTMRAVELTSGESEPAPLKSVVAGVRVPVLLIASGTAGERAIDQAYRARIGTTAMLWSVPDAAHTQALTLHPRAYAARVTTFLKTALSRR